MSPSEMSRRKVGKGPFILVISVLGLILVFVGYPVQRIFLGGRLTSRPVENTVPKAGVVGYLKADEGYGIYASKDRPTLSLWEGTLSNPSGLMKAREMLESGQIVRLMPNTSVLSVDPSRGILKILSGEEFGKSLFVSMRHVRFILLHP